MAGVGEFGESTGASEDFSIISFSDTVYTKASIVNTYKHTFDSQKFLTKRTSSNYHQRISNNPINGQSETTYQYTAGKLTSAVTSSTASTGTLYTSSQRYTYDADGKVTQYVNTGINGATDTQTFEGGILRSYRIVNGQGDVHDLHRISTARGLSRRSTLQKESTSPGLHTIRPVIPFGSKSGDRGNWTRTQPMNMGLKETRTARRLHTKDTLYYPTLSGLALIIW
jgi:hypothetical protein